MCVCARGEGVVLDVEVDELHTATAFSAAGRSPCNGPHDLRCATQQESLRRVAGWGLARSGSCRGTNRSTAFEHARKNAKWLSLSLTHSLSLKIKLFSPAARFMLMSLALLFLRWPCGPPSLQITQKLCYIVWDNEAYRFGHVTGALPSSHAEGRSRPACRS